jgi:hypothetical protein
MATSDSGDTARRNRRAGVDGKRLPDADISTPAARAGHSTFWREKYDELHAVVTEHGQLALSDADNADYRRMSRWHSELPNILKDIQDTLRPRAFDRFIAEALGELERRRIS